MIDLTFEVPGIPVPQGSKRPLRNRATGHLCVVESGGARHAQWRADVRHYAVDAWGWGLVPPVADPIRLTVTFVMPRPKGHYWPTNAKHYGELRDGVPIAPTTTPDLDKLLRSVLDSLTGVVYVDDAQVVTVICRKVYGDSPGVVVRVQSA